jgi:hypothetical protein
MRAQFALPQLLSWTSGSLGMSILRPSTSTVDRQLTGIELWVRSPLLRFTNPILLTTTFLVHTDTLGYVRLDIRFNVRLDSWISAWILPMSAWVYVRLGFRGMSASSAPGRAALTDPTGVTGPTDLPTPPILPIPPNPYRLRRRYRPTPTRSYRARRGLSGAPGHPPPVQPPEGRGAGLDVPRPFRPPGQRRSAPPLPLAAPGGGAGGRGGAGNRPRPRQGEGTGSGFHPFRVPRSGHAPRGERAGRWGAGGRYYRQPPRAPVKGSGAGNAAASPPEAERGAPECQTRRAPQRGAGGWIARAGSVNPPRRERAPLPVKGSGGGSVNPPPARQGGEVGNPRRGARTYRPNPRPSNGSPTMRPKARRKAGGWPVPR